MKRGSYKRFRNGGSVHAVTSKQAKTSEKTALLLYKAGRSLTLLYDNGTNEQRWEQANVVAAVSIYVA